MVDHFYSENMYNILYKVMGKLYMFTLLMNHN